MTTFTESEAKPTTVQAIIGQSNNRLKGKELSHNGAVNLLRQVGERGEIICGDTTVPEFAAISLTIPGDVDRNVVVQAIKTLCSPRNLSIRGNSKNNALVTVIARSIVSDDEIGFAPNPAKQLRQKLEQAGIPMKTDKDLTRIDDNEDHELAKLSRGSAGRFS